MKIITPVCNNPEFIYLQYLTFHRFIREPFEIIVFIDCKPFPDSSNFNDTSICRKIEDKCSELSIQYIQVPNSHHRYLQGASNRHADTMNYIFSYMKENPDEYICIDSDMFLITSFHIDLFRKYILAYVPQEREGYKYIWPNLFYINMHKITHAHRIKWDAIPPMDSGGGTSGWLALQKQLKPTELFEIPTIGSLSWEVGDLKWRQLPPAIAEFIRQDPRNKDKRVWCELFGESIFHYRAGSNWNGEGETIHKPLTQRLVQSFMKHLYRDRVTQLQRIRKRIAEYFTAFPPRIQKPPQ